MASEADCPGIAGVWYPRGSSRATPARFAIAAGEATVRAAEADASSEPAVLSAAPAGRLSVSSRVGSIPRRISLADGSLFETADNDAVDRWLAAGGRRGGVHALERFHPRLLGVVAVVALLGVALYRYAMPALVEIAVMATPPAVTHSMGRGVLALLDRTVFDPSALDPARRARLAAGFRALAALTTMGADGVRLEFRAGGPIGPNAFALPDGTVVVTDGLVTLAGDDDAVLGVLAHELGHLAYRHSLRRLYHAAGATALIMLIGGDIGAAQEDLLVKGSALLTLSYSRDQELEADRYSVDLMADAGRDPGAIARFLERMRDRLGGDGEDDFLSTHPSTAERIEDARRHAREVREGRGLPR